MILEIDVDDTQCSQQIVDVPVPQIGQRFSISRSKLRTHRMRRLPQGTTQQWAGEQVVSKHVQQVVNSMEVKQSKIIKNTVQRKNPIIQQKINQVRKQGRASTFDKLAVVPTVIQSQDPQDGAEYEAWIRQRSNRQKINKFAKHVEIFEEQYIHKEIDVPVMLQSSNSPNRSPRTVEMHQVQSIDTVDNISVNRHRQWQDPGDVSCDGTQVPMIQKMQKTVEILQVQLRWLKSLRSCRAKTSAEVPEGTETRGSSQT